MKKPIIYLAGKMSGLTPEQKNCWREEAKNSLKENFNIVNPCEHYDIDSGRATFADYDKVFDTVETEVQEFDLWAVEHSDIILVNFNYPDSIGTAMELIMARKAWNKPVIAFGGKDVYIHPWIRFCATKRCETLEDAVDYINKYFLKYL